MNRWKLRLAIALAAAAAAPIVYAQQLPKPSLTIKPIKLGAVSAQLNCTGGGTFTAVVTAGSIGAEGQVTVANQDGGAKATAPVKLGPNQTATITVPNTLAVHCRLADVYIVSLVNGAGTVIDKKFVAQAGMTYVEAQPPP